MAELKRKTKKQLAADLEKFLLVKDVKWQKLSKSDLACLHQALMKLRRDVAEFFEVLESQIDEPRYYNPAYIV